MVTNIAAYHFTPIDAPAAFAATLHARAETLALRGSVLVAGEGLNLFLAGDADAIESFLAPLRADLEAEAWLEEGDWDSFLAAFRERGKARCRIAACVRLPDGGEATRFSGRFVALAKA